VNAPGIAATTCRVVAPSSREALRLAREKLGPDAVVLSNRVTAEGVELVAALDESIPVPAAATATATAIPPSPARTAAPAPGSDAVLREIHSMRGMIEEQLAGMAWNEKQRRDPVRGHLLRTLLGAGFSARLAKDILQDLPTGGSHALGLEYAKAELARRMPVLEDEDALMDGGGVYALMGPTGVGKTTTTAKLAARCVMRFGADKLALVTTDSYRIGAYEQLRIYGQILGVSVHAVKDAAGLDGVLAGLRDKHMVLIDTVGMSQRDRAVAGQIAMLCGASRPVRRLLLLNAASHGDTLHEVVQAYRHGEGAGGTNGNGDLAGCIFTKVDEATHPGALIDMAIRHQLPVHYVCSGQQVPEHLALADGRALVDSVFQARSRSALFVPAPGEPDGEGEAVTHNNESDARAAQAASEALRRQCRQLIEVLTGNVQELAANAAALSQGGIGFDETRAAWRQLAAPAGAEVETPQQQAQRVLQVLMDQAVQDSAALCAGHVLALAGRARLPARLLKKGEVLHTLPATLLLSDRTGKVFAALQDPADTDAYTDTGGGQPAGWALQPALGKTVVHLFAEVPEARLIRQWQEQGHLWAAGGSAAMRMINLDSGARGTLAKLAASLDFGTAQPVDYRKKAALMSVAEARICLRPGPGQMTPGTQPPLPVLRCVIRRMVDAASGKLLAHSYVLASEALRAPAWDIAQWMGWRSAAEPFFKLLGQGLNQPDAAATPARRLFAGRVCATVLLLQGLQDGWAEAARVALAQLAGRALKADRPVPGAALLEGLGKLLVLMDALETEGVAGPTVPPAQAPAAGDGG
jgi:flagellar biosynthesis protein FlhF